jgi:trehalose 6-phosphate phosphatase
MPPSTQSDGLPDGTGRILSARMEADTLLGPLAAAPKKSALVFDVDGTLAPIVARPELARVPEPTRAELRRLVARYLLVACVSGRAGDDARRLVGVDGIEAVGNHGLELDPRAEALATAIERFRDEIGLPVEDKRLSLSYHYRGAADEEAARGRLEEVAEKARAAGLDPRWGRKVLEVRPPVAANKGTAVRTLVERSGARRGLYAGDDTTDLDAFAGLAAVGLEHAVRVAVASEEGPPALRAAADVVVDGPEHLAELLALL